MRAGRSIDAVPQMVFAVRRERWELSSGMAEVEIERI